MIAPAIRCLHRGDYRENEHGQSNRHQKEYAHPDEYQGNAAYRVDQQGEVESVENPGSFASCRLKGQL